MVVHHPIVEFARVSYRPPVPSATPTSAIFGVASAHAHAHARTNTMERDRAVDTPHVCAATTTARSMHAHTTRQQRVGSNNDDDGMPALEHDDDGGAGAGTRQLQQQQQQQQQQQRPQRQHPMSDVHAPAPVTTTTSAATATASAATAQPRCAPNAPTQPRAPNATHGPLVTVLDVKTWSDDLEFRPERVVQWRADVQPMLDATVAEVRERYKATAPTPLPDAEPRRETDRDSYEWKTWASPEAMHRELAIHERLARIDPHGLRFARIDATTCRVVDPLRQAMMSTAATTAADTARAPGRGDGTQRTAHTRAADVGAPPSTTAPPTARRPAPERAATSTSAAQPPAQPAADHANSTTATPPHPAPPRSTRTTAAERERIYEAHVQQQFRRMLRSLISVGRDSMTFADDDGSELDEDDDSPFSLANAPIDDDHHGCCDGACAAAAAAATHVGTHPSTAAPAAVDPSNAAGPSMHGPQRP